MSCAGPADEHDGIVAAVRKAQAQHYRNIAAMDRDEKIRAGAYVYFTFLRPFAEVAGVADELDWTVPRDLPEPLYQLISAMQGENAGVPEDEAYYEPLPGGPPGHEQHPAGSTLARLPTSWPTPRATSGSGASRGTSTSRPRGHARRLRAPRAVPEPGGGLVLGVPGGEGRPLVTVIDHEVAAPKAPSLEIRAEGLWADHTVETPFDHMTLGCEAFAIGVDDPAEVYGDLRGDRVPFGSTSSGRPTAGLYPWIGTTRYEVSCNVHGEVLVGDETIEFDGIGQRDHSWGVRDWWNLGWVWTAGGLEDGTRFHTARIRVPGMEAFAPGTCCRPAAASSRSTCARPGGARRPRVPHRRRDQCGPLDSWRWSRYFSPVTSSTTARRPARPASPGRCAGSRPPTAGPAWAGPSGTSPSP